MGPKKQSEQHIIDAEGQQLLRSLLPRHWILRQYQPDYGIDFVLEVFSGPKAVGTHNVTYETLGEHLFIQLKTVAEVAHMPLQLYSRSNVEKQREVLDKTDLIGQLETVRFSLETSELATVERMGIGVPVLLVVADLSRSKCYFVCLNDYIDKILIPRHDDYKAKGSRTIHVPIANEVGDKEKGLIRLRWYAKRAKLYAAFQKFVFQAAELGYELDSPGGPSMARYFASRISEYDFWDNTEMWDVIAEYGAAVKRFRDGGRPGLVRLDVSAVLNSAEGDGELAKDIVDVILGQDILELWRRLALLPRSYEDICREWCLPTALGYMTSYR